MLHCSLRRKLPFGRKHTLVSPTQDKNLSAIQIRGQLVDSLMRSKLSFQLTALKSYQINQLAMPIIALTIVKNFELL